MYIFNKLKFLQFYLLCMTLTACGQKSNTNFNNTIGIMVRTGPAISINTKNFPDGFNLFPTAREDGFGLLYGYKNFRFNVSFTKKVFEEAPVYYGWGPEKFADKQLITFRSNSLELIYSIEIVYLNAGIDFYKIEEQYQGISEDHADFYDEIKINDKAGGHLGFGIKYDYLISHFLLQPFMGFNFFYLNGTCDGIRSDYYLRSGMRIDLGLLIGLKI